MKMVNGTIMSSSSSIMVHIVLSRVMALVYEIHHLKPCPLSKLNSFDQNFMELGHSV